MTLWRWRDDFQNDFAVRMDWSAKGFEEANHPLVPILSGPEEIKVKSDFAIQAEWMLDNYYYKLFRMIKNRILKKESEK